MDPDTRKSWINQTLNMFAVTTCLKFIDGQANHGGNDIGNVPTAELLNEIEHEVQDLVMYLAELRRRISCK